MILEYVLCDKMVFAKDCFDLLDFALRYETVDLIKVVLNHILIQQLCVETASNTLQ